MKLCHFCRAHLSEFLEGTLSPSDREKVAAHLATCPDCAREKRELELTVSVLRELKPVAASPELRLKVRSALQDEAAARRVGREAIGFTWWRPSKMVWTGSLTLAAMALILLAKPYSTTSLAPSVPSATDAVSESQPAEPELAQPQSAAPAARKAASPHPKGLAKGSGASTTSKTAATKNAVPQGETREDAAVREEPIRNIPAQPQKLERPGARVSTEVAPRPSKPSLSRPRATFPAAPLPLPDIASAPPRKKIGKPALPNLALPSPVEVPARPKAVVTPGTPVGRSAPALTPTLPQNFDPREADPAIRFRAGAIESAPAPQAFDSNSSNGMAAAAITAAEPKFIIAIAAAPAAKSALKLPSASIVSPRLPVTPPAPATALAPAPENNIKTFAGPTVMSDGNIAPEIRAMQRRNQRTDDENKVQATPLPSLAYRAPLTAKAMPRVLEPNRGANLQPELPVEQHYLLTVVAPREVKNAQVTFVLPASLRFGANDAANSRVVWRGDFTVGKPLQIDVVLAGVQGGEKILVKLEQNGDATESNLLETQTLTLPTAD